MMVVSSQGQLIKDYGVVDNVIDAYFVIFLLVLFLNGPHPVGSLQ